MKFSESNAMYLVLKTNFYLRTCPKTKKFCLKNKHLKNKHCINLEIVRYPGLAKLCLTANVGMNFCYCHLLFSSQDFTSASHPESVHLSCCLFSVMSQRRVILKSTLSMIVFPFRGGSVQPWAAKE